MASRVVALVVALVTGCSTAHTSDAVEDGGPRADARSVTGWTELGVLARLPGATMTVEGVLVTLDPGAYLSVPRIRGAQTTLQLAGGDVMSEVLVDWSYDYLLIGVPEDTPIERLSFFIARRSDASCGVGSLEGRAGGIAWAGDSGDPMTACGPFGLVRFRRDRSSGPCPPGADCGGFEEITGDGMIRIDRSGAPGAPIVETPLTAGDVLRARLALTEPALMDLLAGERPCPEVTDIFETMRLEWRLESAENETPACDAPELVAVRDLLDELTARYAP